ncbi:hypothetical protein [Fluviicola sp.]|uniref:hypothetical protein n=1 Tax=Fluviicola sp. TaxID=1917219 RepID=UPI0031E2004F
MFFKFLKKQPKELTSDDQEILLQILEIIKSTINPETELIFSYFESVEKLIRELDELSEAVKNGNLESLEELSMHFAPTSSFQELSIQNGWSDEYLKLAESFDRIYSNYK